MSFFQNVFLEEFKGNWVLGDRQYSLSYNIKANKGRSFDRIATFEEPVAGLYDLSGNDSTGDDASLLIIRFAYRDFRIFHTLTIDVAGAVPAQTTPVEIVNILNANNVFSTYFTASLTTWLNNTYPTRIVIESKKQGQIKFFIVNSGAEETLKFNKSAGIAQLPTYFSRHTVDNLPNFEDGIGSLTLLTRFITRNTIAAPTIVTSPNHGLKNGDTIAIANSNSNPVIDTNSVVVTVLTADTFSVPIAVGIAAGTRGVWAKLVDLGCITDAGFTLADTQRDYELLKGQSGLYVFKVQTVNANSQVLQCIEYNAGLGVGDLGRITIYTYTGAQTQPDTQIQMPYVLTAADILTPP